jgi:hypothetical protein
VESGPEVARAHRAGIQMEPRRGGVEPHMGEVWARGGGA